MIIVGAAAPCVWAHEIRPAYLAITQTFPDRFDFLWKVPALGDDMRLGLYVRLPEECEVTTEPHGMFTGGAYLERWSIRHPEALVGATIHVDGLATTLTDVLVRFERLDGSTQVARLRPTSTSFVVASAPNRLEVAFLYLLLGTEHILLGIDHLLFVLALVILVKGTRRLVATITAFTVAHSITLACAVLGVVHVPGPPVEACIALSIMFVASEIIQGARGRAGITSRRPWIVAFAFGLLHGLGFAGALSEVGLPQSAIPVALLFFNIGVEVGQLVFIGCVLTVIAVLNRIRTWWPKWAEFAPPYAIGSCAAFWIIQRVLAFN